MVQCCVCEEEANEVYESKSGKLFDYCEECYEKIATEKQLNVIRDGTKHMILTPGDKVTFIKFVTTYLPMDIDDEGRLVQYRPYTKKEAGAFISFLFGKKGKCSTWTFPCGEKYTISRVFAKGFGQSSYTACKHYCPLKYYCSEECEYWNKHLESRGGHKETLIKNRIGQAH